MKEWTASDRKDLQRSSLSRSQRLVGGENVGGVVLVVTRKRKDGLRIARPYSRLSTSVVQNKAAGPRPLRVY